MTFLDQLYKLSATFITIHLLLYFRVRSEYNSFTSKITIMEKEKIIFLRNFLFRTFLVGAAFGVFYFIATIIFWDSSLMLWIENMFKVNEAQIGNLTLLFFTLARFVLAFLILAPCIALHWMIKRKT